MEIVESSIILAPRLTFGVTEWRAVSPNATSFSRCDVCNAGMCPTEVFWILTAVAEQ